MNIDIWIIYKHNKEFYQNFSLRIISFLRVKVQLLNCLYEQGAKHNYVQLIKKLHMKLPKLTKQCLKKCLQVLIVYSILFKIFTFILSAFHFWFQILAFHGKDNFI